MENSNIPRTRLRKSIKYEEFIQNIKKTNIPEREIRYLLRHSNFFDIPCRNHQLHFFVNFFKENYNKTLFSNELAIIFDMNPKTVRKNLREGIQDMKPPGRHHAFDNETENIIIQEINSRFQANKPMTQVQLINFISKKFQKNVTKGWVNSFIGRHINELQKCHSSPQEDNRLCIPREYLEQHIMNLKEFLQGKCAELIFNLDEVGLSEWEERKIRKVIVPKSVDKSNVFHQVSRKVNHISLLVCVSAAGDALTPLAIIKQKIPSKLKTKAVRLDEDIMIRQRDKPYMDESLFYKYITTVLIPYIDSVRQIHQIPKEQSVLLMDSASCHCSERILRFLGEHNVLVLVYPSHTSNIFQALDLSFFGILKRNKGKEDEFLTEDELTKQILDIIQAYEKTATSLNIKGSFSKAGIVYLVDEKPYRISIDEETLRNNKGFIEIWDKNISIDVLSKRRQNQKFGAINLDYIIN